MHVIPQLRDLESHSQNEIIVIGVHSAKYTTEGKDAHLQDAVRRLHIDHPVVNDREMRIWDEYAVRAWPTLMFVGPDGRVIGKQEGEFNPDAMTAAVRQMLDEAGAEGDIDPAPFDLLDNPPPVDSYLSYPTAVQVLDDLLVIADTGHHRIIIAGLDGRVRQVVGGGVPGFEDGPAGDAAFHAPHGLDVHGGSIYVADTENHSIRRIDLASGDVQTVAGTGRIARSYGSGGVALETDLRSPWDVVVAGDTLYISMAGNHQLWLHELGSDEIRRFAGTGHEGKRDDRVPRAWLAQPSGIIAHAGDLIFADAETSSVRTSSTSQDGVVTTLVGRDLFDWGDVDGPLDEALLQHATDVAVDPDTGLIYVSDTYNNKLKCIDLQERRITTLAGTGDAARADGPGDVAAFFEPHGLSVFKGKLYVADTNNHAVRVIDLSSGDVSTLRTGE
ncbi:thioredoxin-like domain-containing protein [soil metagenome]